MEIHGPSHNVFEYFSWQSSTLSWHAYHAWHKEPTPYLIYLLQRFYYLLDLHRGCYLISFSSSKVDIASRHTVAQFACYDWNKAQFQLLTKLNSNSQHYSESHIQFSSVTRTTLYITLFHVIGSIEQFYVNTRSWQGSCLGKAICIDEGMTLLSAERVWVWACIKNASTKLLKLYGNFVGMVDFIFSYLKK